MVGSGGGFPGWSLILAVFFSVSYSHAASEPPIPTDKDLFKPLFSVEIDKPGGMAFDGDLLWISNRADLTLVGVDPVTKKEKKRLTSPGTYPTGLAFDGELLWCADKSRNKIFGIRTASGLVVRELDAPKNPLGMTFDGEHLWVADGKRIHRLSREDGTTIVSFLSPNYTGKGRGSEQLGMAWHEGMLWVTDRLADTIYAVDPEQGEVIDALHTPGPFPAGVASYNGDIVLVDVQARKIHLLEPDNVPKITRNKAERKTVVLRRRITNNGPDTLPSAEIFVAVPSSLPNQKLESEPAFEPAPTRFVEDKWGQRYAAFETKDLAAGKSMEISMSVDATLYAVRHHIRPNLVGSRKFIPKGIRKKYLADGSKYSIDHPSIKKHLEKAIGDEKRPYWIVRKISKYIGENMRYELSGGWNIAPTVIDRGTGSCSEYTFVFIAMCRAAGIAARYAGAAVVRGDDAGTDEVFHRWAEVYLPGYGWVPVDAQAADKPSPARQGEGIGSLSNRFLITTHGGGGSKYMEWSYNTFARWTCSGRCLVEDLNWGDWYPQTNGPLP